MAQTIEPDGWAPPIGYSNGMAATGRVVVTSGQVGWNPATGKFESDDFAGQAAQALQNVADVLRAAGVAPRHLVRLTWYITSRDEYMAARAAIGAAYRETLGKHFPAMSVVVVAALLEPRAKVEIEATAVVGE